MAHPLDALFSPRKIAVFGASERPGSVGGQVLRNLLAEEYPGELFPINPKHDTVLGLKCFPDVQQLNTHIDLVVIATPAATVPAIIRECGRMGAGAAVVLSAGFSETGPEGKDRERALVREARRWNVPLLGPNCLGVMSTRSRVNATFSGIPAKPGSLALVSQSGALCTAILDWATDLPIGFSSVVSVGDASGVGFGELLDYLSTDESTEAILVYVEGVNHARSFMSGLRAAARLKPTVVLKAGKNPGSTRAAQSHSGALVGSDDVFDAALRRAGAVRVHTIGQLFAAAQLLAGGHRAQGDRLVVVTNAGGPGVMAADRASQDQVTLAELSPDTLTQLSAVMPQHWSRQNPVDILGDAGPERYRDALSVCLGDNNVHGAIVLLTPQAMTEPTACAHAVIDAAATQRGKPVVACWMGGNRVAEGRELLRQNGVPTFNTPEATVDAFRHLWAYHQNQRLLLQVPTPLTLQTKHDVSGARLIIESALKERRKNLGTLESKAILSAFGIRCSLPVHVSSASEALIAAENLGFPVVMKIDSPDISHKTDVNGVRLGIGSGKDVRRAYASLFEDATRLAPAARLTGATVERMHTPRYGREVMVGVVCDPCFGPAINVGAGGVLVELIDDKAVALPPLNSFIIRDMLTRTALGKLLGPWRGQPAANTAAVEEILLRVSDLVCELPEIAELDINPLIVDPEGASAVDARIGLKFANQGARPYAHMAIHPYPADLQSKEQLPDGQEILVRPIRPEDAEVEQRFVRGLSDRSRYFRFMRTLTELTPEMLVRFTQIDYDREMAFVAIHGEEGQEEEIGVSRYVTNPDGASCEFALVVADAWQKKSVGSRLMTALLRAAREHGLSNMVGEVQASNSAMLCLVTGLGFSVENSGDPTVVTVSKSL